MKEWRRITLENGGTLLLDITRIEAVATQPNPRNLGNTQYLVFTYGSQEGYALSKGSMKGLVEVLKLPNITENTQ